MQNLTHASLRNAKSNPSPFARFLDSTLTMLQYVWASLSTVENLWRKAKILQGLGSSDCTWYKFCQLCLEAFMSLASCLSDSNEAMIVFHVSSVMGLTKDGVEIVTNFGCSTLCQQTSHCRLRYQTFVWLSYCNFDSASLQCSSLSL